MNSAFGPFSSEVIHFLRLTFVRDSMASFSFFFFFFFPALVEFDNLLNSDVILPPNFLQRYLHMRGMLVIKLIYM